MDELQLTKSLQECSLGVSKMSDKKESCKGGEKPDSSTTSSTDSKTSVLDNSSLRKSARTPCKEKSKSTAQKSSNPPTKKTQENKDVRPLREFMLRSRKAMASAKKKDMGKEFVKNVYEKAESCRQLIRKKTGVIYDDKMALHDCPWDPNYAENPNRYRAVLERCRQLGLIERCLELPYVSASMEQITKLHTIQMYEKLQLISAKSDLEEMEKDAASYDSIYFNKETFNAALLSTGCAISLVKAVCERSVQNGMAIIRPPGHHAMADEYCGYCYFNNVAIAAQYALDNNLAKKILIVDVDVHHGQATQRMFYEDNRVLYFSIHRYEHGDFWPNLRESNYDYIGEGVGTGFNINFPLNATGLEDSDYFSILTHILLPVAYEFQPDLILVSAGYDACVGCTEGEMEVTPGFYGHLISLLSGLAVGKIVVCLEGGYFLPSLAEGAAMTLKALLGDPVATLMPMTEPHLTIINMINNLKLVLHEHWNCFRIYDLHKDVQPKANLHIAVVKYLGKPLQPPFPTRNCYPVHSEAYKQKLMKLMSELQDEYAGLGTNQLVSCCYDDSMLTHQSKNSRHVELPMRLSATYELYKEWRLDSRCVNLDPKSVDTKTIKSVHKGTYVNEILQKKFKQLIKHTQVDMFYSDGTLTSILKAVDCLLAVVDSVMKGDTRSGVALIRPPGHHAEMNKPSGFCYLNNVAIAAQYLVDEYKLSRVLIIDFDIHHGNGTQQIFYNDKKVLFLSIHRHDPDRFFPNSPEGGCDYIGKGPGKGYNVNVGLNSERLYNVDYITIFHRVVLPIAYSFAPEVVLVSAGFDAGINDTLGYYAVTPECFGHFIQLLKPLANGKIILALEGGYNAATVKYSMNICIKTLLGDPLPILDFEPKTIDPVCYKVTDQVINIHKKFWPMLAVDRKLSAEEPKLCTVQGEGNIQIQKIGKLAKKLMDYGDKPIEENLCKLEEETSDKNTNGSTNTNDKSVSDRKEISDKPSNNEEDPNRETDLTQDMERIDILPVDKPENQSTS